MAIAENAPVLSAVARVLSVDPKLTSMEAFGAKPLPDTFVDVVGGPPAGESVIV
jgi:hypothetical protein